MTLRIEQEASYTGHGRWSWAVWIDGSANQLNRVESVTYYLHPTFPNPVRAVTDRRSKFRLDSSGWGTFEIRAEIRHKDGKVVKRSHNLQLEYPEQEAEIEQKRVGGRKPRVFVVSSVADRPVVSALREALARADVTLIPDSDLDLGLPWEVSLERALRSSDAAIALVSDFTSPFVESEIQLATAMEIPVLPVGVGKGRDVPESIRQIQTVRLGGSADVRAAADQLAKSVHALLKDTKS